MSDNQFKFLYISLNLLNIVDMVFTLCLLGDYGSYGLYEHNRLTAFLINISPYLFIFYKIGICLVGTSFMYRFRRVRFATTGFIVGNIAYLSLAVWHCYLCYVIFYADTLSVIPYLYGTVLS